MSFMKENKLKASTSSSTSKDICYTLASAELQITLAEKKQ